MRKTVVVSHDTWSGDIDDLRRQETQINLFAYTVTVVCSFFVLHIAGWLVCAIIVTGLNIAVGIDDVFRGVAIIWFVPLGLVTWQAVSPASVHVVVAEKLVEHKIVQFVRTNYGDEDMMDLHAWLNDIALTQRTSPRPGGQTGRDRFLKLNLPSGRMPSETMRQGFIQELKNLGLWRELGGRAGGELTKSPAEVARELRLPPLPAASQTLRNGSRPT